MILSNRKLKLIIIVLLLLIFSYFIGIFNVKAEEYNLYSGVLSPKLCRAYYNGGLIDAQVDNFKECQFNTGINTIQEISIFFDTLTYNGYKGYFYEFTGSLNAFNANVVIVNSFIGNSSDTLVGSCNTTTNSTGQITAFTSLCWIPGGLSSGMYSNIFHLQVAHTTGGESPFNVKLQLKDRFTLYNNFYGSNANSSAITNIQNNTANINNSINDSNVDSASDSASTWNSKNATNGTITNLLTLPITLLQAIVNGLQTSCSSFSLGSLFGTNISLPCINVGNLIGSGLWTTIDILFSGFMILAIAKKLIKIFNDFTNLKSNQIDELYGGGNK